MKTFATRVASLLAMTSVILLVGATTANSQSLWKRARAHKRSLFADRVAHNRGDILTVLIREQQRVELDEETEFEKDGTLNARLTEFQIAPRAFQPLPTVNGSFTKDFMGSGKVDKKGLFETRLSVLVVDVQPNGNLVIEGKRNIRMDQEVKVIRISGVVRPDDVSSANTIRSENVANAKVSFEGTGPVTRATSRGWFGRLLDFLWPF